MRPDEIHTELDQLWRDRHEDPPDTADQIRDEHERLDRGVGSENFSDREKRIWNALNAKLEHKIREERIRELADRGGDNVETTDHRPGGGHESERTLNPALARRQPELSEALRAIDRHADSFRHQRDAHRLEQHLRHEDVGSFDARYVAAVAEPAYRTAFRKLLRGRDRVDFTPEEREAVERYRGAENVRTMTEGTG